MKAIGEHLVNNLICFKNYDLNEFKVTSKGKNKLNLKTLKDIYILCKNPKLCNQMKFVYSAIFFSNLNL